ncbi:choline transporter-like protein 3, partial [Bradysia coprophila]|uniref:choline transporter-like protein 3 n=1 Tax=Bradysia coprophila TaxID=38358 RepID=UPI00187DCEF0
MQNDLGWVEYTMPESGKSEEAINECRPVKPRGRTDFFFLVLNFVFIVILFILFGYCFFNGSIYRQINGYDSCGNVCGLKNSRNEDELCSNPDKRNENFLLIKKIRYREFTIIDRQCVANCSEYPNYVQDGIFCTNGKVSRGVRNMFPTNHLELGAVAVVLLIAVVFADIVLVLLRYATKIVVWFTVGFVAGSLVILSIYLLYLGMMLEGD